MWSGEAWERVRCAEEPRIVGQPQAKMVIVGQYRLQQIPHTMLVRMGSARVGLVVLMVLGAVACEPYLGRSQTVQTSGETAVQLVVAPIAMKISSTQAPGRRVCASVMVLKGDDAPSANDEVLSLLEGHMIERGLRVVSAAVTGRVVSDPTHPYETAAKLTPLERALVLAERSKVDCIFQLFRIELGLHDDARYFVWPNTANSMTEVDERTYGQTPDERRLRLTGPDWVVAGKVVDVQNGGVLATVNLQHSTVTNYRRQLYRLNAIDGLLPSYGTPRTWNVRSEDDIRRLRTALMSELAAEIAGPRTNGNAN
jgi:hypothetical protein